MSEHTASPAPDPAGVGAPPAAGRRSDRGLWVSVALLAAVVLLMAGSVLIGSAAPSASFEGTDATVTALLEDSGARPWFAPVFTPASAELESGLFAVQAALGAGLFGYVVGRLHERRRRG